MRQFIGIILFSFYTLSNSATFSEAQNIYNKIAIINNITAPPLVLNSSSQVNADETESRISVNAGLLRFVRNPSELALVLGHELAHFTLHHQSSNIANEYAADYKGAIYMSHAGYNICTGAQLFKRLNSGPNPKDHPADLDRVKHLGCD